MIYAPTVDRSQLAALRADLDQLTGPITVPVRQRSRRTRTRWTALDHPGLLQQLRDVAAGLNRTVRGPERRQTPRSRPPVNVDALDRLSAVYVGITSWHNGLILPSPPDHHHGCRHTTCQTILHQQLAPLGPLCPAARCGDRVDWQLHALRQLRAEARRLEPATVRAIAADVHQWWRWAAAATGWTTTELTQLRRG